jgi:hypothetical protein
MIEQPVSVPGVGTVEVDVISLNHRKDHAILWECKSGRTLDEKQARIYAAMTAEHLQRTGNITFATPAAARTEVVYCCLSGEAKSIVTGLHGSGVTLPVVSLGQKAEIATGQIQDDQLRELLMIGVDLPALEDVPGFLLANTRTSSADLARVLFPTLVSLLRKQASTVSIRQILEESFNDWACMGTDLRRCLSDKFKELTRELCDNELKDYARVSRAKHSPGELLVEFTADILGRDASSRTRTFQKFAKLASGFIERMEKNRPFEPSKEVTNRWLPGLGPDE